MSTKFMGFLLFMLAALAATIMFTKGVAQIQSNPSQINPAVVNLDGCEYFKLPSYGNGLYYTLTHKGNCTNSVHKTKQ